MISKTEYKQRMKSAKEGLKSSKIDTLIISEEEDIYYLTGLTYKSLERLFLLIIKENEVTFILPKMELAHLKRVDNITQIKSYWEYPAKEPERWQDILFEVVGKSNVIGIGNKSPFEIAEFLSSMNLKIQKYNIIEELRWIKKAKQKSNLLSRRLFIVMLLFLF